MVLPIKHNIEIERSHLVCSYLQNSPLRAPVAQNYETLDLIVEWVRRQEAGEQEG